MKCGLLFGALLGLLMMTLSPALSSAKGTAKGHSKSKKPALEVYSALEGEAERMGQPSLTVRAPTPTSSSQSAPRPELREPKPEPKQPTRSESAAAKVPEPHSEWGVYDPVPANQIDLIANRLRLVEKLIREHGRAYDYRIHTNADLEAILKLLESSKQEKTESRAGDDGRRS